MTATPKIRWFTQTAVLFTLLSVFVTFDEWRFPDSLPLRSTRTATVPLFNAWTIGWNAAQATQGFTGYWDAPIFFPARSTFAFSEPQPATLLVAPVVWATGSVFAGYKAWLFLSLFLNGFFAALLLRRHGYPPHLQFAAGAAMLLLPMSQLSIDVLQLVPVWGILWCWSSMFELSKEPKLRTAVESAVALAACFAVCVHHALFLSVLLTISGIVFVPLMANRRFLAAAISAALLAAALIAPIVLPIRKATQAEGFARQEALVKRLSAKPLDYCSAPSHSLIQIPEFQKRNRRRLCPGWCRMLLAVAGIAYGFRSGRLRRWILFLSLICLSAFLFSLGPHLQVLSWKPWQTLVENVPGFRQVRSIYRFAWFVQLATILLAVEGLMGLAVLHGRKSLSEGHAAKSQHPSEVSGRGSDHDHPEARTIRSTNLRAAFGKLLAKGSGLSFVILVLLPTLMFTLEFWPEKAERAGVPDVDRNAAWISYVRDHAQDGTSVACLPFSSGKSVRDFDTTARWMCYGLEHGVPLVNGYSGFFPERYTKLRDLINAHFPSSRVLKEFAERHVGHIVVARKYCQPEVMLSLSSETITVRLVFEDAIGVDVYQLVQRTKRSPNDETAGRRRDLQR